MKIENKNILKKTVTVFHRVRAEQVFTSKSRDKMLEDGFIWREDRGRS